MGYTALYRKFRPISFNEMVGQEHITKTLKNQILADRIGHAYLFSGGRGTGKTTSAKIMARAINCLHPREDGEPCNECEICKAILDGSLTDVVEMDAASNNSVEDVRAIRDEVNFLPTVAKYRVYIIDEVHMLSTGAFNALLKTLEEPPEHVKFILATTEPQKLPATILSRCQRFDFKRISVEDIIKRLKIICKENKIKITEEALKMIAVLAEGALRDGISILERCSQDTEDEITEDIIRDLVGLPQLTYIRELVKCIIEKDVEKAIQNMDIIINQGKDLDNFLWEIIKYVKDILVYKVTGKLELYTKEDMDFMKNLLDKVSKEELLNIIYELSEISNTMKMSTQKNIIFQTGILKLCMEIEEIVKPEKKAKSEKKIEIPIKKEVEKVEKTSPNTHKVELREESTSDETSMNFKCVPYWQNVLDKIKQAGKMTMYANLLGTKGVLVNDMVIGIEFPKKVTEFAKKVIEENENKHLIENIVSIEQGAQMQVRILEKDNKTSETKKSSIENIANELDIPINIIDE